MWFKVIFFILKFFLFAVACSFILLVAIQECLILPLTGHSVPDYLSLKPSDVEQITLFAEGGKKINVWHLKASGPTRKGAILLAHGNGEIVQTTYPMQKRFHSLGYSTYTFDYRGTGGSEGWPWQSALLSDTDLIWNFIEKQEGIASDQIIPVGISFGSGIASYAANRHNAKVLVLVAPFTSIADVIAGSSMIWPLAPFVRLNLPNSDYIAELKNTCVIAAHGVLDTIIPVSHTEKLATLYKGNLSFNKIISQKADHVTIMNEQNVWELVISGMEQCRIATKSS